MYNTPIGCWVVFDSTTSPLVWLSLSINFTFLSSLVFGSGRVPSGLPRDQTFLGRTCRAETAETDTLVHRRETLQRSPTYRKTEESVYDLARKSFERIARLKANIYGSESSGATE